MADPRLLAEMIGFLGDSMTGGTDYAAERNGKHKQALAAASNKLPRRVDRDDRLVYEALGFEFGDATDKLFMAVSFPDGWGTKPTDHYMYTHIVDERGRRRGQYFYKPDFWDQDASLWGAERRFRCEKDYDTYCSSDRTRRDEVVFRVLDQGREIYRTKVYAMDPLDGEKTWETSERTEKAALDDAIAWLKARFPEHENPLAYWSLPDVLDFDAFPENYVFIVDGTDLSIVTATHENGQIIHRFSFTADGALARGAGKGYDGTSGDYNKIVAWATLVANQPKDPRPPKPARNE